MNRIKEELFYLAFAALLFAPVYIMLYYAWTLDLVSTIIFALAWAFFMIRWVNDG